MSWFLRGAVEEGRVAAVEAVGSYDAHLGQVGEEHVVLKRGDAERVWHLGSTVDHRFSGRTRESLRHISCTLNPICMIHL